MTRDSPGRRAFVSPVAVRRAGLNSLLNSIVEWMPEGVGGASPRMGTPCALASGDVPAEINDDDSPSPSCGPRPDRRAMLPRINDARGCCRESTPRGACAATRESGGPAGPATPCRARDAGACSGRTSSSAPAHAGVPHPAGIDREGCGGSDGCIEPGAECPGFSAKTMLATPPFLRRRPLLVIAEWSDRRRPISVGMTT
jgi:hypothetical protein